MNVAGRQGHLEKILSRHRHRWAPCSESSRPRSSPAVADGKVVTLGVAGILTCWDAADGKILWQKKDIKGTPGFSPQARP